MEHLRDIELHNSYSLYEVSDDVRIEKDIDNLKQEVLRQRIVIQTQNAEIVKLRGEIALLDGLRKLRRNFANV